MIIPLENRTLRFREFFNKNYPKVKTFAWQLLKSEEDAEDVAQDIFVKLWENPEVWEERDKLDSYLYTVVRNHIYNLLKHKNVEENYKEAAAQKMEWEELGLPTPDDDLQLKELELLIHLTVGRMPEQRRNIFWMSREQGLSSFEIAQKLNISVRTVEHHIYKALQDLKKIIFFLLFFYLH